MLVTIANIAAAFPKEEYEEEEPGLTKSGKKKSKKKKGGKKFDLLAEAGKFFENLAGGILKEENLKDEM